jgi:hypothetical protein
LPPSAQIAVYCFSFLFLKDDTVHISFLEPLTQGFAGKEVRAATMLCMCATLSYSLKESCFTNAYRENMELRVNLFCQVNTELFSIAELSSVGPRKTDTANTLYIYIPGIGITMVCLVAFVGRYANVSLIHLLPLLHDMFRPHVAIFRCYIPCMEAAALLCTTPFKSGFRATWLYLVCAIPISCYL